MELATTTTTLKNEGPTLLPENVANIVTAVSFATRISLRCSSLFFDVMFEAAKYGTSLSLGISRNALTNAISTARKLHHHSISAAPSSDDDITNVTAAGTIDDYNSLFAKVLDKYTNMSLSVVSHTFSLAELFAISGLQFTSRTIQSSLKTAEESVRIIDGIFGSNETSRAIASIIMLIHRELVQDPDFNLVAKAGKISILSSLTKALTVFAVLQNVTHKRMMKQIPMTVLWVGSVTYNSKDEQQEENNNSNHIIQFKNNNTYNNSCGTSNSNNSTKQTADKCRRDCRSIAKHHHLDYPAAYRITTKTTWFTTKTTTIYPLDLLVNNSSSSANKRAIIVHKTPETESRMGDDDDTCLSFIPSSSPTASIKRRKLIQQPLQSECKKTEAGDQHVDTKASRSQRIKFIRRFSSPNYHDLASFVSISKLSKTDNRPPKSTLPLPEFPSSVKRHASISCSMPKANNGSCISSNRTMIPAAFTMTTADDNNSEQQRQVEEHEGENEQGSNDDETFPRKHIIYNIAHFMKYASAAYGESFMRILGIGDIPTVLPNSYHHHPNHHAFAHHTGNSVEDILLSSYTDRSLLYLHNPSMHALVHYVTVDHAAKAIVLTCRGTLGLSDILTDLSFDYTEFKLASPSTSADSGDNKTFKAHSGMLDAAQLLAREKGQVYQKIRQGLLQYPDYGLVLCGHSLGGGVASLLCVLWSEKKKMPGKYGHSYFVTSKQSGLPAGRPIHCYAYGPPGVMSLELSQYCAGLVTSVVHGYDIVSSLSFGVLKDFKNIATSLHAESDAIEKIISRVVGQFQQQRKKSQQQQQQAINMTDEEDEEDQKWFWAMIKTMRADMTAEKMYPPNTVYLIETIPQINQQFKVVLSRCEDVKARFSEIMFSRTMFMDHSPLMYERAVNKLCRSFNTANTTSRPVDTQLNKT